MTNVSFISFSLPNSAGLPYLINHAFKAGTCTRYSSPEDWAGPVLNRKDRENRARQAAFLIQKLETQYQECKKP
ncbi:hypothetical protein ACLB90_18435 [Stenotrophomonas sp. LGBM10]|uniref:hypothetical protein n=1 Tax=Stenotrophomonas sp. LGBM10 TaxID=3390038 RepID=UPI00398A6143